MLNVFGLASNSSCANNNNSSSRHNNNGSSRKSKTGVRFDDASSVIKPIVVERTNVSRRLSTTTNKIFEALTGSNNSNNGLGNSKSCNINFKSTKVAFTSDGFLRSTEAASVATSRTAGTNTVTTAPTGDDTSVSLSTIRSIKPIETSRHSVAPKSPTTSYYYHSATATSNSKHRRLSGKLAQALPPIFTLNSMHNSSSNASKIHTVRFVSPFPMPQVYHSSVAKSVLTNGLPGSKPRSIGVTFTGRKSGQQGDVKIDTIQKHSPFYNNYDSLCGDLKPVISVGQQLLAVNRKVVTTTVQAVQAYRDDISATSGNSGSSSNILTFTTADRTPSKQYKIICAPTSAITPGVSFTTSRDHCLVTIARIFSNNNDISSNNVHHIYAETSLRKGDIVLAVNGYPVCKVQDADRALHLGRQESAFSIGGEVSSSAVCKAHGSDGEYNGMTSLYVIDIARLRVSIAKDVSRLRESYSAVSLSRPADEKDTDSSSSSNTSTNGSDTSRRGSRTIKSYDSFKNDYILELNNVPYAKVDFDSQSQHMHYAGDLPKRHQYNNVSIDAAEKNALLVHEFIQVYNDAVEQRFALIEEAMANCSWQNPPVPVPKAWISSSTKLSVDKETIRKLKAARDKSLSKSMTSNDKSRGKSSRERSSRSKKDGLIAI